jgi:hypothetical protein
MPTVTTAATEYRNLPLSNSYGIENQPASHLRRCGTEGTSRKHPQPGCSLSLACAASE